MSVLEARVAGIGLCAPGLPDWPAARALLAGEADLPAETEVPNPQPALLPANERRRTTALIRLALQAAQEAAGEQPPPLPAVFASSGGDLDMVDRILGALQLPGRPVSPTHFHNSVHNASAGYWSIARRDPAPSTSLSAYDASFTAGLLEALTQLAAGASRVLLVACDRPPPPALHRFRPLVAPFACAFLLVAQGEGPRLQVRVGAAGGETRLARPGLERLRVGNPAARALPLLERLARAEDGECRLPATTGSIGVSLET